MLRWIISIKTTTKYTLAKDLKDATIKQSLIHKLWTETCKGSGGSALGDTVNKALLISWIGIPLYYFRIV